MFGQVGDPFGQDAAPAGQARPRSRSARCGTARARPAPAAPRTAGSTRTSFGSNACRLGWNLNPRTPCSVTSRRARATAALPGVRVDRAERDQHVGVLGGLVGDLLAGQRRVPGAGGGVDGEHHGGDAAGAVVLGDRRRASACGPGRRGSTSPRRRAVPGPARDSRGCPARRGRARRSRSMPRRDPCALLLQSGAGLGGEQGVQDGVAAGDQLGRVDPVELVVHPGHEVGDELRGQRRPTAGRATTPRSAARGAPGCGRCRPARRRGAG